MQTEPIPSDRDLMQQIQRGDLAALELLHARHHPRIYGFLLRWLGDAEGAEDLVQETFFRVLRECRKAPPHERLLPWMIRIARNLAIDQYRRERPTLALDDDNAATIADAGPLPLERMTTAERDAQLSVALAALTPMHREVLLLRSVEGLDHREIGATVGCSEATARVRLHRATLALRAAWHSRFGGLHD